MTNVKSKRRRINFKFGMYVSLNWNLLRFMQIKNLKFVSINNFCKFHTNKTKNSNFLNSTVQLNYKQ